MSVYDISPAVYESLTADFQAHQDLLISVANWADLVTAPRGDWVYHPHDGINNYPDQVPGSTSQAGAPPPAGHGKYSTPPEENRPPDLPVAGMSIDKFYDGARLLSGQGLNDISHLFNIVASDWSDLGTHIVSGAGNGQPGEFRAAMNDIFKSWHGTAASECENYVEAIIGYITVEQKRVSGLADCLAAYGGIIVNARKSLIELMKGFVTAMGAQMAHDAEVEQKESAQFITGAASTVASAAVSIVLGLPEVGAADIAKSFITVAISLANSAIQQAEGKSKNLGGGYAAITNSYFQEMNGVLQDARKGLVEKNDMLRAILNDPLQDLPRPLFNSKQFDDKNHDVMVH
jgi:hypothetical protein